MDTLNSTLQPYTASLPPPLRNLGLSLLGPHCYTTLILHLNPYNPPCLTLAISKTLGIAIVAGSAVVKVPQILKLLTSKSAAGVSFLSYALETASLVTTLAYSARNGFPFSTYGETALIAVQNVVICLLVLRYSDNTLGAAGFVGALVAAGWALQDSKIVDGGMLKWAQAAAGVVGAGSKLPQVLMVWREGGTGVLSAFAVFNYLVGSLSRIFTTVQEVDDPLILYGFVAGFVLNAVLAGQMVSSLPCHSHSPHPPRF